MGDAAEQATDMSESVANFQAVRDAPCTIDQVTVSPHELQTRLLLVLREFKAARQAGTFEEVLNRVAEASEALEDLGVFKNIEAGISPGVPSKPGTCNLDLDLEEKGWYAFNAGTQVGLEGAVTAEATGKLRNLTGNCEQHSVTVSHGRPTIYDQETELTYRLRFPRIFGKPVHAQWSLYQQFQNAQADSSYTERQRGAGLDFIRSDGALKVGYELSWLQLYDATRKQASQEVLKDFGDHIKSALHATYVHDRRTLPDAGTSRVGHACRASAQVSGLTPDASPLQFVQGRLDYQLARPLSAGVVLTCDAATGVVVPILGCRKDEREVMIRERFFLGGVSSLRGFAFKGVGPRAQRRGQPEAPAEGSSGTASADAGKQQPDSKRAAGQRTTDALGGDMFATLRAAVNFALPQETLRAYGIQGHIFGDTGSVTTLSGSQPASDALDRFWNQWRLAVGLGVKLPFGRIGSLELNFVQPLSAFELDLTRPGLQIGFSSDAYLCNRPSQM